ncbi:MAG: hypothetical protein C0624_03970 [Desulfuromonas sp.]|nr:MAG: hypothetical protein C0624_03970 [Desulfuromonas sp.]
MLGALTGDIIGSRFEWHNHKHIDFELFDDSCCFTDDSVHTVALAEALLTRRGYGELLREYYQSYPDAGYGKRFSAWVEQNSQAPYNSFGNGAAMRVSPTAWFYSDLETVVAAAEKSAAVTHNHPEGLRGARCIAGAIFLARSGATKKELRSWVAERCGYDLSRSCDDIRPDYTFDVTCQGTVGPAVSAFLESRDFEQSVRLAVSLGGDSDTLACITASISEAFYGNVPQAIAQRAWSFLDPSLRRTVRSFFAATGRPLPLQESLQDQ